MEYILELISTVGFPIACAFAMGLFIWKIYKASEVREDKLMTELEKSREATSLAIQTINEFSPRLDSIESTLSDIKQNLS